jgi:hypothetical protein
VFPRPHGASPCPRSRPPRFQAAVGDFPTAIPPPLTTSLLRHPLTADLHWHRAPLRLPRPVATLLVPGSPLSHPSPPSRRRAQTLTQLRRPASGNHLTGAVVETARGDSYTSPGTRLLGWYSQGRRPMRCSLISDLRSQNSGCNRSAPEAPDTKYASFRFPAPGHVVACSAAHWRHGHLCR